MQSFNILNPWCYQLPLFNQIQSHCLWQAWKPHEAQHSRLVIIPLNVSSCDAVLPSDRSPLLLRRFDPIVDTVAQLSRAAMSPTPSPSVLQIH